MALVPDKMLDRLARDNPDKKNWNPWNMEKMIHCVDLLQRYKTCKQTNNNDPKVSEACKRIKRFTYQCYHLEERYYLEYLKSEMTEEQFFDKYMGSVASSIRILPKKEVWHKRSTEIDEDDIR